METKTTGAVRSRMAPSGESLEDAKDMIDATKAAIAAFGNLGTVEKSHALMVTVELQAMLDGKVDWVSKSKDQQKKGIVVQATPAQVCGAVLVGLRNGMLCAAGHYMMMGAKMYVNEPGYYAAAEFTRTPEGTPSFKGFEPPVPISDEERQMLGIVDKERYLCAVKIVAHRHDREWPANGYGWWDVNKDNESSQSVPSKMAITRARRHGLRQLYSLGMHPSEGDSEAEVIPAGAEVVPAAAAALLEEGREGDFREDMEKLDEDLTPETPVATEPGSDVAPLDALRELADEQQRGVCQAFLRFAWHSFRDCVEKACDVQECQPQEAKTLPTEDLVDLVEEVGVTMNDDDAFAKLLSQAQRAVVDA